MGSSSKLVFRVVGDKGVPNPRGYIYLQRIVDRKKSYKSLGLPAITKNQWDEQKQRVKRTSSVDYGRINNHIEKVLRDYLNDGGQFTSLDEKTDRRSFIQYVKKLISSPSFENKHGTRRKYNTVTKKIQSYLEYKNLDDLFFKDLTIDWLDGFQSYMLNTGMAQNTVTNYLKIVHSFVKRSMVHREIMNTNNPFIHFKYEKKEIKIKQTLTKEEVFLIKNAKLENGTLRQTRDMFLFQFFSGGMRVSDLLTLRYRNLINGRLNYNMFKTNRPIDFELSESLLEILSLQLTVDFRFRGSQEVLWYSYETILERRRSKYLRDLETEYFLDKQKIYRHNPVLLTNVPYFVFVEEMDFSPLFPLPTIKDYVDCLSEIDLSNLSTEIGKYLKREGRTQLSARSTIKDPFYDKKKDLIMKLLELVQSRIVELTKLKYSKIKDTLTQMGTDTTTKNDFVFGRLSENEFGEYLNQESFNRISEKLYSRINKSGINYNRDLKSLQRHLGLNKTLKTHLPRTSFTNIMMTGKVNHRDISNVLGHSSVSITDEYLKTGFTNHGVDKIIKGTSDDFNNDN